MKIKARHTRRKKAKFVNGHEVEQEVAYQRLPQLNKFYARRRIYG